MLYTTTHCFYDELLDVVVSGPRRSEITDFVELSDVSHTTALSGTVNQSNYHSNQHGGRAGFNCNVIKEKA